MNFKPIAIFENTKLLYILHNPILNYNELEKKAYKNYNKIKKNENKEKKNFLKKEKYFFIIINDNKNFDYVNLFLKISNLLLKFNNNIDIEFLIELENYLDEIPKKKISEIKKKNFEREILNLDNINLSSLLNDNSSEKIKSLNFLYNITKDIFLKKKNSPILENLFLNMPKINLLKKEKKFKKDFKKN